MLVQVRHRLEYAYDRPVFLEPTTVRLCPRTDHAQRLMAHELAVEPEPAGRTSVLDVHGNPAVVLWFSDMHQRLVIRSEATVRTVLANPFDYLVTEPGALWLPVTYATTERAVLEPYLARMDRAKAVEELAVALREEVGAESQAFLMSAVRWVPEHCEQVYRASGEAWLPGETLARRQGACRDLAVLFVELCRAMGVAARFVSGYQCTDDPEQEHEMHAWAEAYLPGMGWRGYDPSLGLVTADRHVAVASGPTALAAAPTQGSYRGSGASSRFAYELEIRTDRPVDEG